MNTEKEYLFESFCPDCFLHDNCPGICDDLREFYKQHKKQNNENN